jgi:hypothetical protein
MLRRVATVRTEVSEECNSSIIRVTRIGELGPTLAVISNRRSVLQLLVTANVPSSLIFVTLMMKALHSSETSILTRGTWCSIQEDAILHSHRREYLKSHKATEDSNDLPTLHCLNLHFIVCLSHNVSLGFPLVAISSMYNVSAFMN